MEQAIDSKRESGVTGESPARAISAPESEGVFIPDVDIYESGTSMRLLADMPGAEKDTAEITVANGVLTIEAPARVDRPAGYDLAGQEYEIGRYRRDFRLSDSLDHEKISARMRNGVLELTIPKRARAQKRTIRIET